MNERPSSTGRTYHSHSDTRDRGARKDRVRPSDLPQPLTREEAEAQAALCRTHIADIDSSLGNTTAANFASEEAFADWRKRTSYARSQWESRLAIANYDVEHLATREAGMRELATENEHLRKQVTEIRRLQVKAQRRRALLRLERMWMIAVLTGDAPPEHRNAVIKALQARIRPNEYRVWLERSRAVGWNREGPMGSFHASAAKDGAEDNHGNA